MVVLNVKPCETLQNATFEGVLYTQQTNKNLKVEQPKSYENLSLLEKNPSLLAELFSSQCALKDTAHTHTYQ